VWDQFLLVHEFQFTVYSSQSVRCIRTLFKGIDDPVY
jgi:hypothetical protein